MRMGLDGEACYENPASMSWTSSLVARRQRDEGNGYDRPKNEATKKNYNSCWGEFHEEVR